MTVDYRDVWVDAGNGLRVAVRDYPANGVPLVLLHGAGLNLALWDALAELLAVRYHLVAIDFLGHGASDTPEEFDMAADLAAVEAVIAELGLIRPAVVGHSYGGMVALRYAHDHPDCPVVVNVDGLGNGRVEQYAGKTPAEVREFWARFRELVDNTPEPAPCGPDDWRAAALEFARTTADVVDVPPAALYPVAERAYQKDDDGRWTRRPLHGYELNMMGKLAALDVFDLYPPARCPAVMVLATKPPRLDDYVVDFSVAYRAGLADAYADLSRELPFVQVIRTEAGHDLPVEDPIEMAELILKVHPPR